MQGKGCRVNIAVALSAALILSGCAELLSLDGQFKWAKPSCSIDRITDRKLCSTYKRGIYLGGASPINGGPSAIFKFLCHEKDAFFRIGVDWPQGIKGNLATFRFDKNQAYDVRIERSSTFYSFALPEPEKVLESLKSAPENLIVRANTHHDGTIDFYFVVEDAMPNIVHTTKLCSLGNENS